MKRFDWDLLFLIGLLTLAAVSLFMAVNGGR